MVRYWIDGRTFINTGSIFMNQAALQIGYGFCFGLGFILVVAVMEKLFGMGIC